MARVLKNTARIELSRQLSLLEIKRNGLRRKLNEDHPQYPPKARVMEIRKVSQKINSMANHINLLVQDRYYI